MRYLLAILMMAPLAAQQPDQQAKPVAATQAEQKPAEPKPAEEKPAETKAAESPAPATESWINGSIDLGYRWLLNNQGNFTEYRSVVNLGAGPRVFGMDLTFQDPNKKYFDRGDFRGFGWGDPNSYTHFNIKKQRLYDFTVDYRSIAYFNAVPSFANPAAPAGFNEQSFDIYRRNTGISLDLLPGRWIQPYVAYERNWGSGHGISTFVPDANDEFAVPTLFHDRTTNIRGGTRFEFNRFHVTLEHASTGFRDDDSAYDTVKTLGDRTTPLLGQTLYLSGLAQAYGIRGDGYYDKVLVTANPFPWLDVYGQFLYSNPKITVHYNDLATGNFADITQLLFYSTLQTTAAGIANQPHVLGSGGFELRPLKRMRIIESLSTDRSHDAASPLIVEQLIGLTGAVPSQQTITTALNYHQVVNYNQQEVDVLYDLTNRITLRGGYRLVWGDATVLAGELSQTGLLVSGELHRNVGLAGATLRATRKLTANFDYEGASSDNIYFRTSLNNYSKARARANYQATGSLSVQVRFQVLDNQNPDPTIRYDFLSRDNAVAVFWTPNGGKRVTVTAEYDRSTLRSDIRYLDLFLAPSISSYRDNAHTATSAVTLAVPGYEKAKLTFGGSLFISSGSRPSRFYEPLVRLSVPISNHVSWNTEWQYYGYGEQFYLFEGFRTHIFMTGLRLTK